MHIEKRELRHPSRKRPANWNSDAQSSQVRHYKVKAKTPDKMAFVENRLIEMGKLYQMKNCIERSRQEYASSVLSRSISPHIKYDTKSTVPIEDRLIE